MLLFLLPLLACNSTPAPLPGVETSRIVYELAWDDEGVIDLGQGRWRVTNDIGWEVTVDRAWVSTWSIMLDPCVRETVRNDWSAIPQAHAGHTLNQSEYNQRLQLVERIVPGDVWRSAELTFPTERFCALNLTAAHGPGQTGVTMALLGTATRGEQVVRVNLRLDDRLIETIDLREAKLKSDVVEIRLLRPLAHLFDTIDFAAVPQTNRPLDNLLTQTSVDLVVP